MRLYSFALLFLLQVLPQKRLPSSFEQSLRQSRNVADSTAVYNNIAKYFRSREYRLAILYADSAMNLAIEHNLKEELVTALNRKAVTYKNMGEYNRAIQLYDSAFKILEETPFKLGLAMTHNNLGVVYEKLGKYENALSNYAKSLVAKFDIPDSLSASNTLNNIGKIHRIKGHYDSALLYYQKSLIIRERSENQVFILSSILSIAALLIELEEYDSANYYYRNSLNLSKKINRKRDFGRSLNGLAIVNLKKGKFDTALHYLWEAKPVYRSFNSPAALIPIYSNLGNAHYRLENLDSSLFYHTKSLELSEKIGMRHSVLESNNNIGNVHRKSGAYEKAIVAYQSAVKIAKEIDAKSVLQFIYYSMSQCYYSMSNYKEAYSYYKDYAFLHDTLVNEDKNRAITELRTQYNLSKTEIELQKSEITLLRFEQENKSQRWLMAFLLLMLTVSLFVFYLLNKQKEAQKKVLEKNHELANQKIDELLKKQEIQSLQGVLAGQEEERKRIAGDLHDKLGAILGMVKLHFSAVEDRIDVLRDDNKQQYEKANALLDQASEEVRNISHNLVSGVLTKFGLAPALNDLKDKIESTGKLKVQLLINDMDERLSGEQELQLYRIVQELVSNILKHAKAQTAVIQLNRVNGHLNLIVEDDGIGFDPETVKKKEGMGMQNLQARVVQLGGKLHYDSGKGAGTTVSIDIPINE